MNRWICQDLHGFWDFWDKDNILSMIMEERRKGLNFEERSEPYLKDLRINFVSEIFWMLVAQKEDEFYNELDSSEDDLEELEAPEKLVKKEDFCHLINKNYKLIDKMIDELLNDEYADPIGEGIPGDYYREIIWETGFIPQ